MKPPFPPAPPSPGAPAPPSPARLGPGPGPHPFAPPAPPLPWPLEPSPSSPPVGSILMFTGPLPKSAPQTTPTPPQLWGWVVCDGRQLDIKSYPELFNVIGYTYSPNSSGDTFNVPDYRGYFLRGVDGGSGNDPDARNRKPVNPSSTAEVGTLQGDAFQLHEHEYSQAGVSQAATAGPTSTSIVSAINGTTSGIASQPAASTASETRPKNISVYYLIRYTSAPSPWPALFQPPPGI